MNAKEELINHLSRWHTIESIRGNDVVKVNCSAILYLRYNKNSGVTENLKGKFWFGVTKSEYEKYCRENFFITCLCGVTDTEVDYLTFPRETFEEFLKKIELRSGQWKFNLLKDRQDRYYLQISNVGKIEVTEFVNYFDFSPPALKRESVPRIGDIVLKQEAAIAPSTEEKLSLIDRLKVYAKESRYPDKFEEALTDYFNTLGFAAKKIGGPGETDILVEEPYRFVVDAKSTKQDSKGAVNFTRIKRHKVQHKARYMVVVSVSFQPAVAKDAEAEGACLVSVDVLESLYILFCQNWFSPFDLERLFSKAGLVDDSDLDFLRDEEAKTARFKRYLQTVIKVLDFRPRGFDEIKGRLEYHCEDKNIERISEEELRRALEFLQTGYLGIVGKSGENFYLMFNQSTALEKLGNRGWGQYEAC
jgi:hypothetical protein